MAKKNTCWQGIQRSKLCCTCKLTKKCVNWNLFQNILHKEPLQCSFVFSSKSRTLWPSQGIAWDSSYLTKTKWKVVYCELGHKATSPLIPPAHSTEMVLKCRPISHVTHTMFWHLDDLPDHVRPVCSEVSSPPKRSGYFFPGQHISAQ